MKKAFSKGEEFLQNVNNASKTNGLHIWWLGQSGFLLQYQGFHLLSDPYLSDSLTEKYADTDKPHVRLTELVIDPSKLDFIDVITSSHNHTDHLDPQTLQALIGANAEVKVVAPRANRKLVSLRTGRPETWHIGIGDGEKIDIQPGFSIFGLPAAHNTCDRDENGDCLYMGYLFKIGPYTVYHSGDTLWHDDIIKILTPKKVDVAILPINGNVPSRRVAGNLNSTEAVKMAKNIGARVLIPCHYDMFSFNTADPDELAKIAKEQEQDYKVLSNGEGWTYSE